MGNFLSSSESSGEELGFKPDSSSSDDQQDLPATQETANALLDTTPIQKLFFLLRQPVIDVEQVKQLVNKQDTTFLNQPDVAPSLPPNGMFSCDIVRSLVSFPLPF